jgi:hypothetical protein
MNYQSIDQFIQSGEAFSDKTEIEINSLIEKYPWFEGGQILCALYKHKYGKTDALSHLQKAQLYMHNPAWLSWQILRMNDTFNEDAKTQVDDTSSQPEKKSSSETPITPDASKTTESKIADTLSFEPLHTVDYFASQGIKLQQEQIGSDKLSQQVKTFTQWLKTMKKIYHQAPAEAPQKEDKQVEEMADASNRNEEIYTETMAEVLIHQGKKIQAIMVYEKLSLLHPEKSSYFTSRISELKD